MGHQAQHVAGRVDDAGDGVGRAIGVLTITEDYLALALEPAERLAVGEEIALAVADRHGHLTPALVGGGEAGLGVGHFQRHRLADVFEALVAQQGAGQHSGFAEDLEAVADADGGHAARGGGLDRLHHRRQGRHGPAAQVVAVGKAARQHDQVQPVRQIAVAVPDHGHIGPRRALDGDLAVPVTVGAGEDDHGGFHLGDLHPVAFDHGVGE